MTLVTIPARFRVRGGTAAAIAADASTSLSRELIFATDTFRFKLGDGVTAVNALPYFTAANLPIADAGGYFTGTDVEAALQEIGLALATPGGSGDAVSFAVAQVAHGFSVGHLIQLTGGTWAVADADAGSTVADAVVSAVADADNFTATMVGKVTATTGQWDARTGDVGGLTAGEYYWTSGTAGGLTKTQSTTGIAQCVGVALSTTVLLVNIGEAVESATADPDYVATATVAAASKATPVDADVMPIADSAAANVLKKLTWANLKATLWTSWGALIAGGTDKATPVDADMLPIADSAASNATKKLTLANLIAYIKAALGWAEGTYTPTLTNTTNIAASTAFACQYLRQGNTVTVSGRVNIDPTAGSVATLLGMSLPIASNFASVFQAGGTAVCTDVASLSAGIIADTVNDRVSFSWVHTADASNRAWSFSFTYRVI